jgi:hypothetical protein
MPKSKKELLIMAGNALYGERWQTDLARDLGLSDGRRIRQWLSGDRSIPEGVTGDLVKLLLGRKVTIGGVLGAIVKSNQAEADVACKEWCNHD